MAETLVEFFEDLRQRNTFEWTKDGWITALAPGHCEMDFQSDVKRHVNFRGTLHGGVSISFADALMGTACFTLGKSVTTLEISGNYIKGVPGGAKLHGVANVEHNGSRTMVTSGRIYNEAGELVFMSKGTFFILGPVDIPDLSWSDIPEDARE